jgi:thioredoxin reductase
VGIKNWFINVDYTIVGSGIVGLHAAFTLAVSESKILVLEKGMLPQEPVLRMLVLPVSGISK